MNLESDSKTSLSELAHHGVKGMKWGVRNNNPTSKDIHDARIRQGARVNVHIQAVDQLNFASANGTAAQKKKAVTKFSQTQRDLLTSEDRVTATRMTNGEKVAAVLLSGPIGVALVGANHIQVKSVTKSTDKHRKM